MSISVVPKFQKDIMGQRNQYKHKPELEMYLKANNTLLGCVNV